MLGYDRIAKAICKISAIVSRKGVCCIGPPLKKTLLWRASAA